MATPPRFLPTPMNFGPPGSPRGRSRGRFFDPFADLASRALPRTMTDAFNWVTRVWAADGTLREALSRVVAYFLTDVEIDTPPSAGKEVGQDERRKYRDFLDDTLDVIAGLKEGGENFLHCGIVLLSVLVPIRRYLQCPQCGHSVPFRVFAENASYSFTWDNYRFCGTCKCGYRGAWRRHDQECSGEDDLKLHYWNPLEIEINHNPASERCEYYWHPPERLRTGIRQGKAFYLEDTPWPVIQAIKDDGKIRLNPRHVLVLRDKALATLDLNGWGLSKTILNFRQIWQYQILQRSVGEIASDFILPFRVLTPVPKAGRGMMPGFDQDSVLSLDQDFSSAMVEDMVAGHRLDPTSYHILPFALQAQTIGGEAKDLVPHELLAQALDNELNAAGVPAELFKGTLSIQALPGALRLFERHWQPLVRVLNQMLAFIVDQVTRILQWEPVRAKLRKASIADDVQRMMAKLQLYPQNLISGHTAHELLGTDWERENRMMLEEAEFAGRLQQDYQARQAKLQGGQAQMQQLQGQAGAAGAGAPGAAPPAQGQGGASGYSPVDLLTMARQIAEELGPMPDSERRTRLMNLRRQDQALHHLVRVQLEELRSDAESAGRQAIVGGGGGKAAAEAPRRPPVAGIVRRALREGPAVAGRVTPWGCLRSAV